MIPVAAAPAPLIALALLVAVAVIVVFVLAAGWLIDRPEPWPPPCPAHAPWLRGWCLPAGEVL